MREREGRDDEKKKSEIERVKGRNRRAGGRIAGYDTSKTSRW